MNRWCDSRTRLDPGVKTYSIKERMLLRAMIWLMHAANCLALFEDICSAVSRGGGSSGQKTTCDCSTVANESEIRY